MARQTKSTEQILKANLAKTLGRIKTKVASAEELWLDCFTDGVGALLQVNGWKEKRIDEKEIVASARVLADLMLDEYEDRWGKIG